MPRPLDGVWSLASTEPGAAASPQDLDRLDLRWIPCRGPMPAAAALREAGEWTLDQPRDFDASDWWYRCRFACDPRGGERIRFEGLATIADAWLNGRHILHSDNMFVAHTVEVDLRASNELLLRFSALPLDAARQPRPSWRTRLVLSNALRWHRTTLLGRMPGWCPSVAPVGPWRSIFLVPGRSRIEDVNLRVESVSRRSCEAAKAEDAGRGMRERSRVGGEPDAVAGEPGHDAGENRWTVPLSLRLSASASNATLRVGEREAPLVRDGNVWTGVVDMDQPSLWWPHTHGAQPLYDVHARVDGETIDLGRVGFRTIEIDRGEDGKGFGLVINGEPIFCRGVCWTPLDIARLHVEPREYRAAIEQLRDAGVNMIRIAGPMTYEAPAFHDLCDELGILVWQDLMFASMDYPWEDEPFARSVEMEVSQVLASLQARPSLAVVCGGSEIDMQAAMLGKSAARRPNRVESEVLPGLVRTLTDAVWVPGTPDGGADCCRVNAGVSHYYGVGAYRRPFEDARRAGVRFAAECLAFSNIPESATIDDPPKMGVPRDRGADWDFEDVRDHYVEQIFGVDAAPLRAHDPERWLALGRVATGEAMLRTFSEWRRPGSSCRGALVWLARDLQPGAGWGVIDASGQPKAAYWYLKRAFAPVALLCTDEGLNGLWLHAINESSCAIEAELRVAIYRGGTRYGTPAKTTVTIPARGSQSVCADALFDEFVDLTGAYRFGSRGDQVACASMFDRATGARIASAVYCAGSMPSDEDGDLELAAAIETEGDEHVLVLRASRLAHAVRIEAPGWTPDNNYFHLEPDEDRRVALRPAASGVDLRVRVSALNASRSVTVAAEAIHAG